MDLDEIQLDLRRRLRRRVDKSAILRALLAELSGDQELLDRVAGRL